MHKSIPNGSHLEFINIEPLNPLISKCEIKVLYTGKNRNRSFISKEVANRMANSLPGTPIVGQHITATNDFGDHGEELVIDDDGVRFEKNTVPYGFVPLEAKAWWANYTDYDGVEREYLVTEGYLWTGRYPECERILSQGNHQSMELHGDTLVGEWNKISGEWSKIENDAQEYFIINDATFTALCILGEDVEPCFEGANITKTNRTTYSLDKDDFKEKMLDFMADLKDALNKENKGGTLVEELNKPVDSFEAHVEDDFADKSKKDKEKEKEEAAKKAEPKEEKKSEGAEKEASKEEEKKSEPAKKEEEKPAKDEEKTPEKKEDNKDEKSDDKKSDEKSNKDKEEEKKKKAKYDLEEIVEYQELLSKFNELQGQFNAMSEELNAIKPEHSKYKKIALEAESKAKDDMINSFYMLSDEDKKEIIENKANFSLEDIEAKLSVICVRKKVNFDLEEASESEDITETPITTFNVEDSYNSTPAWLRAVEAVAKNRK